MAGWLFDKRTDECLSLIGQCEACQLEFAALKNSLILFDQSVTATMPNENYWAGYEARLRYKLAQADSVSTRKDYWQRPMWLVPATIAALVLVFGMVWSLAHFRAADNKSVPRMADNQTRQLEESNTKPEPTNEKIKKRKPGKPEKVEPKTLPKTPHKKPYMLVDPRPLIASANQPLLVEEAISQDLARHFERSLMLLRSFRNASPNDDDAIDLSYESQRSRQLLYQNIVLRRDAETARIWPVEEVLSRLEPLLLDIANLPATPTEETVNIIKERIEKKDLVAQLQFYSMPMTIAALEK